MTQKEIEESVGKTLATIEREREREIISRRYGLFDRKETLEQIGELLGITRERVRQLEKSVMSKLREDAAKNNIPGLKNFEEEVITELSAMGNVARVSALADKLINDKSTKIDQSRVAFLSELSKGISVVSENDNFHLSVAASKVHNEKSVHENVSKIVKTIKDISEPKPIDFIAKQLNDDDPKHVSALASTSKHLATLNGVWGLVKWPTVNPKNIRDKIYVILKENGKHMHFNEISEAIKESDFKRKNVTTQAIHNELIKDKRFVLIGRGIYALKEWGYKKGTVADIISEVLKDAGEPLHRDEIVKRVLKSRYVKETTILLNLQGKSQFQRTAKATYMLASE